MRIALISDIHGNLPALSAVLKDAAGRKVEALACLGDIVGYGAHPRKCLEVIRGLPLAVIRGNHDEAAASEDPLHEFSDLARASLLWTRRQLTEEDKAWLRACPLVSEYRGVTLVHASLFNAELWPYMISARLASVHLQMQTTRLSFFGHTHSPLIFRQRKTLRVLPASAEYALDKEARYAINVGSVGQPRDGNWKACYAIYDSEAGDYGKVYFHRLAYDIEAAQQAILETELPEFLASRLIAGE